MTLIRQRNEDLITLANGGRNPISTTGSSGPFNSPTISRSLMMYHQRVQRHARLLYSMLREKLQPPMCKCGIPHIAHLELKMRSTPPTKLKARSKPQAGLHSPNQCFTFSLIFSTQKSSHDQLTVMWREFQLEPINDHSCKEALDSTFCVKSAAVIQESPRSTVGTALSRPPSPRTPSLPIAATTSERGRSVAPSQILRLPPAG